MSEHQQIQQSRKPDSTFQKQAALTSQTHVSHPASIIQRARIDPKSLTPADVLQLQRTIGNRAVGKLLSEIRNSSKVQQVPIQRQTVPKEEKEPLQGMFGKKPEEETCPSCVQRQEKPEEEEPIQGKFETIQRLETEEDEKLQMKSVVQRQEISEEEDEPIQGRMIEAIQRQKIPEEEPLQKKSENNTGMPDNLKAGVESLSGIDMSDVRVHYNSSKPAEVGALAYTQGTNIHVAPGQEKHLPHEAWHVVQQAQGRVRPTVQLKDGAQANDDEGLEHEADVMGANVLGSAEQRQVTEKEELVRGKLITQNTIDTSTRETSRQMSLPALVKNEFHRQNWNQSKILNYPSRILAFKLPRSLNLSPFVAQLTRLNGILVDTNTPYPNQNQAQILQHMQGEWDKVNNHAVSGGHLLESMKANWGGHAVSNSRPSLNPLDPAGHPNPDHVANKAEGVHFAGDLPGNNITPHEHTFRLVHNQNGEKKLSLSKNSTFWPRNWGEGHLTRTLGNSYRNGANNNWASKENTTYWYRWQNLGLNTVFPIEKVPEAMETNRNKMKAGRLESLTTGNWSRRRFRR